MPGRDQKLQTYQSRPQHNNQGGYQKTGRAGYPPNSGRAGYDAGRAGYPPSGRAGYDAGRGGNWPNYDKNWNYNSRGNSNPRDRPNHPNPDDQRTRPLNATVSGKHERGADFITAYVTNPLGGALADNRAALLTIPQK